MKQRVRGATIAAVLVAAGLAGAQTTTPADAGRTDGLPSRRCHVLKAWRQPNGAMAYQVRAEDTGEVMVVIENGPPRPVTTLPDTVAPPTAPAAVGDSRSQSLPYSPAGRPAAPVSSAVDFRPAAPARGYRDRPYAAVPPELRNPAPEPQPPVPAAAVEWARPLPADRPPTPAIAQSPWTPPVATRVSSVTQYVVPNGPPVPITVTGRPMPTGPAVPVVINERPVPSSWAIQPAAPPAARKAPTVVQTSYAPAPPAHAVVSVPDLPPGVSRLLTDFRGQLLPSLREVAAEAMTRECQRCPERVVPALMEGAQSDPAPTVRACCARCLGELRFRTLSCRSLLESLRGDEDPRVRAEAEWALARFNQP